MHQRLYVANQNGRVSEVNNLSGTPTVVPAYASGFSMPYDVALDPTTHTLYVADLGTNSIGRITNVGGTPTVLPQYAR